MNAKQILAIGLSVCLVLLAIAAYKLATFPATGVTKLGQGARYVIDKCADVAKTFAQPVNRSTSQNDCLEVKPIAELAFAKIRVRSIKKYERVNHGSSKLMIAHQAFDIRMGWSQNDNIRMVAATNLNLKTVQVYVPPPHVLTITTVEAEPVVLYRADGLLNKLTPEDGIELTKELREDARQSADWDEGTRTAKEGFERFLRALFQLQGYDVTFNYSDPQKLSIQPPAETAAP
jgi:hypothetical protein